MDERGSIYLEALVATALLALALLPVYGIFGVVPAADRHASRHLTALNLARSELEWANGLDAAGWTALAGDPAPRPASQPGYEISRSVQARPAPLALKDVTVTVTWADHRGRRQSLSLSTAVARRDEP